MAPAQGFVPRVSGSENCVMADDKSKRGRQDRTRVSGEQGYEVDYFARSMAPTREARRCRRTAEALMRVP
jgi:hypothetical protein